MSLTGLTIAITGSRRGSELSRIVKNLGGRPYVAPTVGIEADLKTPDNAIVEFIKRITKQDVEYMIFMTGPGVLSLMSIAKSYGMEEDLIAALQKVNVVARSSKPQMVLKKYGIGTHLIPHESTSKGILKLLKNIGMQGRTIGILWHGGYQMQLREELYRSGAANVIDASTYQYSFELNNDGASILTSMGFNYVVPIAGESRAEGEQQQTEADVPVEITRAAECAGEEDRAMCMAMAPMKISAAQWCIWRMSSPPLTSKEIRITESNAADTSGPCGAPRSSRCRRVAAVTPRRTA